MIQVITTGRLNGSLPPPYLDGGVVNRTGNQTAQIARQGFSRRITVPVRGWVGAVPQTRQLALLEIPNGLSINLAGPVGLGGLDKGVVAALSSYTLRAYSTSAGVVGLMAVLSGTAVTLPTSVVWESPVLAALVTDGAGNLKEWVDCGRGIQQPTTSETTLVGGGVRYRGWLVAQAKNANINVNLPASNVGLAPGVCTGVAGIQFLVGADNTGGAASTQTVFLDRLPAPNHVLLTSSLPTGGFQVALQGRDDFPSGYFAPAQLQLRSDADVTCALVITSLRLGW